MADSTVVTAPEPRAVPVPLSRTVTFSGQLFHFSAEQVNRLFWRKITHPKGGCWEWTGQKLPNGYGKLRLAGRDWYTHRVSYELHYGSIAQGLHLDHLCRNRACCNPAHLDAVSCKENIHRSPIALAAVNARKTHCDWGHELSGENLLPRPNGQRHCRTCARWRQRVKKAVAAGRIPEPAPPKDLATVYRGADLCRAGHPWTESSTYLRPNGVRECRICREQRGRSKETRRG